MTFNMVPNFSLYCFSTATKVMHLYVIRYICFVMATGQLFSRNTQALFYNYKQLPIQRMLDFDFLCGLYQLYHLNILPDRH